ncbi:MAG: four helix bundle protein [Sphingobacteriales bacterium 17-39-43]|uniref:four helix bundle protein n=1 Tax=Daejeonella sp. TaxID=2805397 RepID=UPI000BD42D3D|nr:four helix bundle protein [Daejeonella sp.]OYZ30862.1 MAG: four helix bundle protein [Sphingobacteriales bacterium 16-39-50]OYZ44738.1 MAG: four helix bundle protein [Sphingobacteriales bacterium 24-40-4]OZA23648.1 MAG: four helix bundle protein [Sphingobacteriales bacterium 17-39-43]HQS07027.1 four helix bundle protein [Daejeonella sp.]HQT23489.1 four helix bundle protein [Daejeonella sp.]
MHNFRKLNIWLDAIVLAKEVYKVTSNYPKEEKFGLVSQINRCSVSVPSNIAEGSSRSSNKEFSYFIKVALGSLFELETQLILSNEFGILDSQELDKLVEKIIKLQKMLTKFLTNLEQK